MSISRNGEVDKNKYILENFGKAIKENWLEVYYQPIIRGSSRRVCGEEALVRWDDPVFGVMNPNEFVPILESVNLVDRLDLYVLDRILEKISRFKEIGLYIVTHSINFSQVDFYSGDIVSEVQKRVESYGVSPAHIAIDISENIRIRNNEQVLNALERFRSLGFKIWMDGYGSGDFAPILVQRNHFDMLKMSMELVSQIKTSESARIIMTELVRMANALGIEVAAEGVEDEEQVEFLSEIGCVKLQGFYYCKPIPLSEVLERYRRGNQIGFENPDELEYYTTVGSVNLYDLSFANNNNNNNDGISLGDYFDTFPMAILQVAEDQVSILRCNATFRSFLRSNFPEQKGQTVLSLTDKENVYGKYAMNVVRQCAADGKRIIFEEMTSSGKTVQLLAQKIAENPVSGVSAINLVILQISETPNSYEDLSYNYIARVLAEDYIKLFFVDLETDDYVEYATDGKNRDISVIERGKDFFNRAEKEQYKFVYREDRARFIDNFTKEQVLEELEKYGKYTITYRTVIDGVPTYLSMKAVRIITDNKHILIGISDVDAQTRQQEAFERIKEERITFNRITALSRDFINIYSVDPNTGFYEMFKRTPAYDNYELEPEGKDFFKEARANLKNRIYKDDLDGFMRVFTKDNILKVIEKNGLFNYTFRLMIDGKPTYVTSKTALVEELDGPQLIFGLVNIDEQVRKEKEFANTISEVEAQANRDELTGVKNKHAYSLAEEEYNVKIESGKTGEFAVIVCDLNGLKEVNDNFGHQTGDAFIQAGCKIICTTFAHSPVYRVGGDEFVVIAHGADYGDLDKLVTAMENVNERNSKKKEVTIAVGVARFNGQATMSELFDEADAKMYLNKKRMKKGESWKN